MSYGRNKVLAGEQLTLRAVLVDDTGMLINADSTPQLYIYDESLSDDEIQAEIDDETFSSAVAGPLVPTNITTGFYEYTYTVPAGSNEGTWRDIWVADVNTVSASQILDFEVVADSAFEAQTLGYNELLIIELEDTILDEDGNSLETTQISFSTEYKPLYASPDLVRLELGPVIDFIPDDALALMIHWASKEADFLAKPSRCNNSDFEFARTKFVVFAAACRAAIFPLYSDSGKKKSLGDLSIDNSGNQVSVPTMSSGIDVETYRALKDLRDQWARVVNAGGCIVPGQSIESAVGLRSKYDPGRREAGRLWARQDEFPYYQPTVNTKKLIHRGNKRRFVFDPNRNGRY